MGASVSSPDPDGGRRRAAAVASLALEPARAKGRHDLLKQFDRMTFSSGLSAFLARPEGRHLGCERKREQKLDLPAELWASRRVRAIDRREESDDWPAILFVLDGRAAGRPDEHTAGRRESILARRARQDYFKVQVYVVVLMLFCLQRHWASAFRLRCLMLLECAMFEMSAPCHLSAITVGPSSV